MATHVFNISTKNQFLLSTTTSTTPATTITSTAAITPTSLTTTATAPEVSSAMMNGLVQAQLILMITIALIGSFGNILVLLVLTKTKHRAKTSSVLLLNLAVCDTLVSALCIPLDITYLIINQWIFGSALCKMIYPFQTSLIIVSSYTLMFMLLERNMIFSNSIRSKLRSTTVKSLAFVTWVLSGAMVLPYALKLHVIREDSNVKCDEKWSNDFYRKVYTVSLSVVEYLIPMVFIICSVTRIVKRLRQERNMVKKGLLGLGRRTSKRRIRTQRRLAIIFIVMVITYGSLKLPNNVLWQWVEFGGSAWTEELVVIHMFVGLCAYSTCATNPFILILMSSEFRKDIRNMFCPCKKPLRANNNNVSSSECERTAMITIGTIQSSLSRTFSTRIRRKSGAKSRPDCSRDESENSNTMKKCSVSFQEPEQIPMAYLTADVELERSAISDLESCPE